jgi:hypothetical protein
MMPTTRLTLSALCAAILFALSLSATTPALARGGGWMVHQTTKFMMKNGARFHMNTRKEALARQQQGQLASTGEGGEQAEDPGWFIELISICDHLKDTEITCE